MTVYARTERGQQAAYDPQSDISRKLRSILKVIDGKTSDLIYEDKLRAFGDVRGMLHSLNMAGLIAPVPEGAQRVLSNYDLSDAERTILMQPKNADDWSATRSGYAQSVMQTTRAGSRMGGDTLAMPQAANLQTELQNSKVLQSATELMGSFVLTYIPEQSFQILKEIEQLNTLEMLAVMLGGYEQMISHLGEAGIQHVRHIKKILRESM